MAAELVETSRLFARTVAAIDPAWAEELAGDLAHRQLSDPHWSKDAGAAVAAEKVTLFGVEIIPRRRVQLARIDRPLARELFLRHALVDGEWNSPHLDKKLTAFERATSSCAAASRRSRSASAAATSSSATRPSSRSTTRASARRVRRALVRDVVARGIRPHAAPARHDRGRPAR
jgi:HrpA-like RNA helicase